jgi:hypothetical protein
MKACQNLNVINLLTILGKTMSETKLYKQLEEIENSIKYTKEFIELLPENLLENAIIFLAENIPDCITLSWKTKSIKYVAITINTIGELKYTALYERAHAENYNFKDEHIIKPELLDLIKKINNEVKQ